MAALGVRIVGPSPPSEQNNKGPALVAVTVVFTTFALLTTILRLWVRNRRRALGWDDYTITAAMCTTLILAGLIYTGVKHGKGKRSIYLSKAELEAVYRYGWICEHFVFASMALVKTSICLLVKRIKESKTMSILTGIVITVVCASALECSIVLVVQCTPIRAGWHPSAGKCWPEYIRVYSIYVQIALSILTDLLCSLLPIAIMWNVRLSFRKKFSIWALMAMGLVCTACSVGRAKSLNPNVKDFAYEYAIVTIWAMAEICLGIIATNLGLSRSTYHYFFPRVEEPSTLNASHQTCTYGSSSRSRSSQHADPPNSYVSRTSMIERRSEDSDVPLRPVLEIRKTTEIDMRVQGK